MVEFGTFKLLGELKSNLLLGFRVLLLRSPEKKNPWSQADYSDVGYNAAEFNSIFCKYSQSLKQLVI